MYLEFSPTRSRRFRLGSRQSNLSSVPTHYSRPWWASPRMPSTFTNSIGVRLDAGASCILYLSLRCFLSRDRLANRRPERDALSLESHTSKMRQDFISHEHDVRAACPGFYPLWPTPACPRVGHALSYLWRRSERRILPQCAVHLCGISSVALIS